VTVSVPAVTVSVPAVTPVVTPVVTGLVGRGAPNLFGVLGNEVFACSVLVARRLCNGLSILGNYSNTGAYTGADTGADSCGTTGADTGADSTNANSTKLVISRSCG
jgi:hypothetical protein